VRVATLVLSAVCAAATLAAATKVPAGTDLSVRTSDRIEAKEAKDGQTFPAVVENDVTSKSGVVWIPKGSPVELVVRKATSGGTVGSGELILDLQSVTVNGRKYQVNTSQVAQKGKRGIGKNRRTAEMVGGGAAVGAVIGAVAGGGKGAAIGGLVGAVAGGATQVLTRGSEVKVPPETVLTFTLSNELNIR
jgi:hypothetical protein